MCLYLRDTNAADIYPHEQLCILLWRVLFKRIIFNEDPRPLFRSRVISPNSNSLQFSLCCQVAYGLRQIVEDRWCWSKLDGTWKPKNHFTSVPRVTLLRFLPWISGGGSFRTINSCIILCTHPSIVMSLHVHNIILCVSRKHKQRSNQMMMSDLKGDPIWTLVGYLHYIDLYCIHPMCIHHWSFSFHLCLVSHILPVPRCVEVMARAVVAEEHRAWLRSTFVPQPASQKKVTRLWILHAFDAREKCVLKHRYIALGILKRNKSKTNGLFVTIIA